jgi:VanZ family protein
MSAIYFFSTDNFSGEETGTPLRAILYSIFPFLTEAQFQSLHFIIRKTGHFTEYGILALLLFRAFRSRAATSWKQSWAIYSLLIIVIYAFSDEYHQTFTESRVGSIYDSLTDIAGGFTALFLLWLVRRKKEKLIEDGA